MSASMLRVAFRGPLLRAARPQPIAARAGVFVSALPSNSFSTTTRVRSEHAEETFEEFSAR